MATTCGKSEPRDHAPRALRDSLRQGEPPPARGWRRGGPYWNGQGADRIVYRIPLTRVRGAASVRATLYYQSLPPYYLAQRFGIRCGGAFPTDCAETRRLAFLASRLRTSGTAIENWKLLLATGVRQVSN